jgi:hypothetical protein
MPEVREVFQMATQKVRPDPGALERQHRDQRRHAAKEKVAVYALVASLVLAGIVIGVNTLGGSDRKVIPASSATPTATSIPSLHSGVLEPGTYVIHTLDRDFDAQYRVTIDVPDGYLGFEDGSAVVNGERIGQMAVSAWVVGNVYADPCQWSTGPIEPPPVSSVHALVAALAGQRGVRVTRSTDITVDGFSGKYMERTAGANLAGCDGGQIRTWLGTDGGERYVEPGQRDMLWIVDVDGTPLLIDASLGGPGTSAQDRAQHIRIAESVRIDPR